MVIGLERYAPIDIRRPELWIVFSLYVIDLFSVVQMNDHKSSLYSMRDLYKFFFKNMDFGTPLCVR